MSAYSQRVLQSAPLLAWRLGESAGPTAADDSGNSRTGTYNGTVTYSVAGALANDADTAVTLSGASGDKITSAYAPFTTGGSGHTFMGWAKRADQSGYHTIFGASGSSSPLVRMESGTDKLEFFARNGGGGSWAASGIGIGQWRHVAVTFSGAGQVAELFVDGVSRGQITSTQDYITASAGNFQVGDSGISAGTWPFKGSIDEVALFPGVLPAADIRAMFELGRTRAWRRSVPDTRDGISVTTNASAWVFGSWADVLTAGWTNDVAIVGITAQPTYKPGLDTTTEVILEIGTGSGPATIVQFPYSYRKDTAVGYFPGMPCPEYFLPEPVIVPKDTRIAVRAANSPAAANTYNGIKLIVSDVPARYSQSVGVSAAAQQAASW